MSAYSLSWSSVSKYRQCPAYAYFEVVERVKTLSPWKPLLGRVVHAVIENGLRARMAGHDLDAGEIHEVAIDEAARQFPEADWGEDPTKAKADQREFVPRAVDMASVFLSMVVSDLHLVDVERRVSIRWSTGVAMSGIVDHWFVDGIGELKTTWRTPSSGGSTSHRVQASLYGLAFRALNGTRPVARIDYLIASEARGRRSVRHLPVLMLRDELEREAELAAEVVHHVAENVAAGRFPRDVSACDSIFMRRCPHYERCRPGNASKGERGPLPHDGGEPYGIPEIREVSSADVAGDFEPEPVW